MLACLVECYPIHVVIDISLRVLFSEGSFTWMNIASLLFLDVPLYFPVYGVDALWTEWVAC